MVTFSFADVTRGQSLISDVGTLAQARPALVERARRGDFPGPDGPEVRVSFVRPFSMAVTRPHLLVCPAIWRHLNTWQGKLYVDTGRSEVRLASSMVRDCCRTCVNQASSNVDVQKLLLVGWASRLSSAVDTIAGMLGTAETDGYSHTWTTGMHTRLQTADQALALLRAAAGRLDALGAGDPDADMVAAAADAALARHRSTVDALSDTAEARQRRLSCHTGALIRAAMDVAEASIRAAVLADDRRGYLLVDADDDWGVRLGEDIRLDADALIRGTARSGAASATDIVDAVIARALAATTTAAQRCGPTLVSQLPAQFSVIDAAQSEDPRAWLAQHWWMQTRAVLGALAGQYWDMLTRVVTCPAPLYRVRCGGDIPVEVDRLLDVFGTSCRDTAGTYTALVPAVFAQAVLARTRTDRTADVSATVADASFDALATIVDAMPDGPDAVALLWSDRYVAAADLAGVNLEALSGRAFAAWSDWPSVGAAG